MRPGCLKVRPGRRVLPAAAVSLIAAAGAAAQAGTTISVQLEDLAAWRTRLQWSCGDAVLVYTERRVPDTAAGGEEVGGAAEAGGAAAALLPEQWALGFECPQLAVGRVRPAGLLRQLASPLGFQPGSEVYRETGGLALDRAIDPGSRRGGELRLAGGRLRLLAFDKPCGEPCGEPGGEPWPLALDEGGACAGVSLCLPARSEWSGGGSVPPAVELLALLGEPPAGSSFEDWYTDTPPYPGGLLSHCAAQIRAGAEPLELRLSGAVSAGERVRQGGWGSATCTLRRPRWDAQLLAGACSGDYRAPGGEAVRERLLTAGSVRVRAAPAATVELRVERRLNAASGEWAVLAGQREWVAADRVRLRLQASGPPAAGRALLLEASAERGSPPGSGPAGEARVSWRRSRRRGSSGSSSLSTELCARLAGEPAAERPSHAALDLRWRRRGQVSLGLEGGARLETGGELQLHCSVVLWRPGSRLHCRLRAEGPAEGPAPCWTEGLSFVLGWEAKGPRRAVAAGGSTARGR